MRGAIRAACLAVCSLVLATVLLGAPASDVGIVADAAYATDGTSSSAIRSVGQAPMLAPTTTTVPVTIDTYVRDILQNTNEGGAPFLRLSNLGNNRALVHFDQAAIQSAIAGGTVVSAKLRLTIVDNSNLWGGSGRPVAVHRLTKPWIEGNGFVAEASSPNRGTGSGATYECAVDSNIANHVQDCGGATAWNMDNSSQWPFVSSPTDTETISNGQSGAVEWDVTSDVVAFNGGSATNHGWIVKKVNESQVGWIKFASRQNSNSGARPVLVLSVNPAVTNTPTPTATTTSTATATATHTATATATTGTAPIANDDAYAATGNVRIATAGRSGFSVLANDTGTGLSVTAADTTSARGGEVAVAANGTFSYNPPAGYEGPDSFTYTVSNSVGSDTGTVTITISGMLWFIDNAAPACTTVSTASGCGRLTNPLTTLAAFEAANGGATMNGADVSDPEAGDHIFIATGSGSYTAPLTLENDQRAIGGGATSPLATLSGITPAADSDPLPATGGTRPSITSGGNGVNLAANNRLHGLAFDDTAGTAIGSTGNVGTLILGDIVVNNDGSNGAGIVLDDGGTSVTATGTNTITTTIGTALNVTNTTIAAAGLTFQSIASSGGSNAGIVLNATGSSGGLTVTGTGSAGSGGTITGKTVDQVILSDTSSVSLSGMNVTSGTESGIVGTDVAGLSLNTVNVTNNGDDAGDDGIRVSNMLGSSAWTDVSVTGSARNNVLIDNTSGTLNSFTVSGASTFSNLDAALGANALLVNIHGTATLTSATITGATISNNADARGVTVQAQDSGMIGSFTIESSTFQNNGIHVSFEQADAANAVFRLVNNPTFTGSQLQAVNVFSSSTTTGGTLQARIQGNAIGNDGVPGSGSAFGSGIRVLIQGLTDGTVLLDDNVIRQTPFSRGIEAQFLGPTTGAAAPVSDVTVTNNDVNPQDTSGFPLAAIYVSADSQGGGSVPVQSDVRGNTVPAGPSIDVLPAQLIVDEGAPAADMQLVDSPPASPDCTTQLTSTNTGSAQAATGCTVIGGPISTPP